MAHEVETGFTARVPAWHRLGLVTDSTLTAEEALVAAGLDRLGRLAIGLTTDPMTDQAKRLVLA